MNADLCGPQASELEKQLAAHIILEWLLLTPFEVNLSQSLDSEKAIVFLRKAGGKCPAPLFGFN